MDTDKEIKSFPKALSNAYYTWITKHVFFFTNAYFVYTNSECFFSWAFACTGQLLQGVNLDNKT